MLAIAYAVTGGAYDFYAFDSAGLVWDGADWVAWDDVDFEGYRIPAAESGASGRFIATLPDGTARYSLRASGVDLAGSYLVWEEAVDAIGGALTPEQATWLEETHAKAMLIGSGGAIVTEISPVDLTGRVTLYTGVDHVAEAAGPVNIPVSGSRVPSEGLTVYFQARKNQCEAGEVTQRIEVAGKVATLDDVTACQFEFPAETWATIENPAGEWTYFVLDRPEGTSLQDCFAVGRLTVKSGPIKPE